jgi:diguanylate cyclase (GGDEF)-like protein
LTQLPNRRLLTDRLQQALLNAERQHSKLAVCCLDLDGFKPVNDVHGHEAGDLVLIEVAGRLGKALRPNDTAARLGGDEFVLLLTNIQNQQEYDAIFDRILQAIAAPIVLEGGATVRVTASIGMASYPCDGQDPDQLLRYGDKAMYRAKQAGHNCVRYYSAPPPASEQQ